MTSILLMATTKNSFTN